MFFLMRAVIFFIISFPLFLSAQTNDKQTINPQAPLKHYKQKYDWLKLKSNEWLRGDILSMYKDELEFDSKKLKIQMIDWDEVVELRSRNVLSMRLKGGVIINGYLIIKDGKLTIVSNGHAQNYILQDLLFIASSDDDESELWDGYINFGANFSKGNTEQLDYTLKTGVQRRSSTTRFKSDYIANYSETKIENDDSEDVVKTADSKRLTGTYDWFYNRKIFIRAADFEFFSDEFINIDYRISYGISLGYHFIDTKKTSWDVTAGPSYQEINYLNVLAGENTKEKSGAIALSTTYSYEITHDIDFNAYYQVQVVNEESGDFVHQFRTSIDIDLVSDFVLDLSFYLDRIETPRQDELGVTPEQNDYRLTVTLGYDF